VLIRPAKPDRVARSSSELPSEREHRKQRATAALRFAGGARLALRAERYATMSASLSRPSKTGARQHSPGRRSFVLRSVSRSRPAPRHLSVALLHAQGRVLRRRERAGYGVRPYLGSVHRSRARRDEAESAIRRARFAAKVASNAESLERARELLGHADGRLTQQVYMRKPTLNPARQ
jgi:hypothetical protein